MKPTRTWGRAAPRAHYGGPSAVREPLYAPHLAHAVNPEVLLLCAENLLAELSVLSMHREPVPSRDVVEGSAIDSHDRRLLVVKSSPQFHAVSAPIASHLYYLSGRASGAPASELLGLPNTRMSRP